ncbi:MAG: glycosyltransferase family 4 protein [Flavobacteriales bacterium]
MRVLIISHKPPYPIIDGGCLAMARLLNDALAIQEIQTIDYFCFSTHKHPFNLEDFPENPKLKVYAHSLDTRIKPIAALFSLLKQESYNLARFYASEVLEAIERLDRENNYDYIIFESLFTAIYARQLKKTTRAKLIYRSHNIEHQIWKDLARNTKNIFKRWYLLQLAYSLKWAERSIWSEDQGGLHLIMSISDQDAAIIEAQTLTSIKYLPASIEQPEYFSNLDQISLCFIGAFDWQPNIDAVDWIIKEVLPLLQKSLPNIQFHIAGKGSDQQMRWQTSNVVCHGFVPDSKQFIAQHGIFISGLQAGSGVKMKVLEAMSVKAPMVLTEKSAEGLHHFSHKQLHTDANGFAQECLVLLNDHLARKADSEANHHYYQQHFDPKKVQTDLLHLLKQL